MSAPVSALAAAPGSTAPPRPQPMTEATLCPAARAVLQVFVVAVPAAVTLDTGLSTTMAGGPSLLTRRGAPGIPES